MSDGPPFDDFNRYDEPAPLSAWPEEPPAEQPQRNFIRPVLAVLVVVALVGGSLYAALRPYLVNRTTDDFSAVLVGVVAQEQCDNITVTDRPLLPTRNLCVCGRLFSSDGLDVNFTLELLGENDQSLVTKRVEGHRTGRFCYRWRLSESLSNGRYVIEIKPGPDAAPLARLRFRVLSSNEAASLAGFAQSYFLQSSSVLRARTCQPPNCLPTVMNFKTRSAPAAWVVFTAPMTA